MENITAYRNAMAVPLNGNLKTEYDKYKHVIT